MLCISYIYIYIYIHMYTYTHTEFKVFACVFLFVLFVEIGFCFISRLAWNFLCSSRWLLSCCVVNAYITCFQSSCVLVKADIITKGLSIFLFVYNFFPSELLLKVNIWHLELFKYMIIKFHIWKYILYAFYIFPYAKDLALQ